ncbi:TetR/AcrR family transcriptional regulator [Sinirhodobacter sp. WL0062]|uniref:TetR/AcrR family transcriptional regulator n=1 Tax=Rhodobacter flavimaris TaxID=2907145 RepID=A0ABS8YWD4_9RHOB|nr:TetR/AcrR family transcriptional regulator [Sinirhodobacter sp. WL0062]MCE5974137.1 TetR/AcrR family transcriptional regulator [Sinirhodobacter sp. WL0062]
MIRDGSSAMTPARKLRPSKKREATAQQTHERIRAGAWQSFVQYGLEGATVSAIVRASGISTGTFYNYYGTKEAVFDRILEDLTQDIRTISAEARARADDLETMLRLSYAALLDYILGLDGARAFIAMNQHHIRSRLYGASGSEGIVQDLRGDIARGMPGHALSSSETDLIARLIISNGIEAVLLLGDDAETDTAKVADLVTGLLIGGIHGMRAE